MLVKMCGVRLDICFGKKVVFLDDKSSLGSSCYVYPHCGNTVIGQQSMLPLGQFGLGHVGCRREFIVVAVLVVVQTVTVILVIGDQGYIARLFRIVLLRVALEDRWPCIWG